MTSQTPPSDVVFRALERGDYAKGYCALLGQLTTVGNVTEDMFAERFALCNATGIIRVVVGELDGRIVAAATVILEPKFARSCAFCAHIEDVVVDAAVRGRNLGRRVIAEAVRVAQAAGCYKVILDCSEDNAGFYEKCGFVKKEVQMRMDITAAAGTGAAANTAVQPSNI